MLFLNYFKAFCLIYYDDKTATFFTPIATMAIIFGRLLFGKIIDDFGFFKYV